MKYGEDLLRVLNVNVVGLVRVSRAALPRLRKSKSAAIVNTCSIAATAGIPKRVIYSATKRAVLSLTLVSPLQLSTAGTSLAVVGGMQGLRIPK